MAAAVEMRHSLANKIESEILRAKEDLQGVDENLRRLTGRDFNGVGRSESHRFSESDASGPRNSQPPAKRQSVGGIGVFARLGDVVERSPDVGSRMNGLAQRGRSGVLRRDSRDGPPQRGDMEGYGSDHEGGRPPGGDRRRGGGGGGGGRGDHISFRSPPRRDGGMSFGGRGGRRTMEEDGGFRGGRGGGVGSRVYSGRGQRGDTKYAAAQEEELEGPQLSSPKPSVASSVARATVDTSRVEAAAVVTTDRASRDRNRRMFGALLGTLQSFKKDEAKQRDKEEQRLAVEKKLELKGIEEQERLRQEKRRLWEERRTKQMHIRRLAEHAERVKEHEQWAEQQLRLTHFIRTKASPPVFWLPRTFTRAADKLKQATSEDIQCEVSKRREHLEEELQQLLQKTERSGKEQPDYLDFGGDEGDDLDYDGDDAGGELVWPSGRGKVGMDGEARDSSRDARDLSRDGRSKDVSVGKLRRGREGEITPEGSAGVSGRRRDSDDDADLTSTGNDVLLSGRMVVQVGGASVGERSVGGVRRVVEVIEEDACKKRKGGDASASKSARLKLLAADLRDITIKVERGLDGSEEKENRKIVVEKTLDKGDKGKDKNKKKGKSEKIKDVDNAETDLEDEVTRMRKRIVEKARKMENEEKEKNLKKMNGDMKGGRKNTESESSDKTKENTRLSLGLSKTENKKPKEDGGSVNVKVAKDKPTPEELEAIKDITEGVASCEESCEEDEVVHKGKNEDLADERNEADSSVDVETEPQAEVSTAPAVVTDPLDCPPAVSAAADDADSLKENVSTQEQQEEHEKKDGGDVVLTMELQSFENFDDDGTSQGELVGDALQLTVDPMEKAMMEADVEGLDSLEPESKSSRSREKRISGSVSSSRSTSKASRSSNRSGVDYKNGKYDSKSKDANKTSANKHDRNSKVDAKSKFDKHYSKPGFSSDASQSKVIKQTSASSSSGKFGVKVTKLDESLSNAANVSESDVSSVMRVDASSVSKNGQSDPKFEEIGKQLDSIKTKEKQHQSSGGAKKLLSNDHRHDKMTESAKDKQDRNKSEPGAVGAKLSDGKLPKADARKTEKTAAQQKVVVQTAVKDVTQTTAVEKSSKHEKSFKKTIAGITSKSSEEAKSTSKSEDAISREENRANLPLKSTEVYKKVDEKRREPEMKKKTQSDQKAVDQKETGKVSLKTKSVSKSESGKDKLTKELEKVYREPTDKKKDDNNKTAEKKKLYKSEIDSEVRSKKTDRDNQDNIDDFEHTAVTSVEKRSSDIRKRKVPSEDVDEEESHRDKKKSRRESPKKRQEGLKKSSTDKTRRTDDVKHHRHHESRSSSDDSDDSSSSDDSDDDSGSSQSGEDSSSSDDSSDSSSNSSSDSGSGSESEDQNIRQKHIKRSNVSSSGNNRNIRDKRRTASDSDLDDNDDEEEEDNRMRNPPTKKGGSSKSADAGEKNSRGKLDVRTKTSKKNMVEDERDSRKEREFEKSRDGRSKEATAKRRRSRSRENRSHESRKVSKK